MNLQSAIRNSRMAVGGSRQARLSLCRILEEKNWEQAAQVYRMLLFGVGSLPKEGGKPYIDPATVKKVLHKGGKLFLPEALHCRVRYFTDGVVLGSKAFVQAYFQAHRDRFGEKRKSAPRPMAGSDWQGLITYGIFRTI